LRLVKPPARTSVVQAAFVKLFGVDLLLVLQEKSDVPCEGSLVFENSALLLTIGECIEDKCFICHFALSEYNARMLLLHMCHSQSGHVLKMQYMGE